MMVVAARGTNAASIVDDAAPTLVETIACVSFFIFGNGVALSVLFFLEPHKRPMPTQFIESSMEYVKRLSNNETYKGETLNTVILMILFCALPIIIQLTCNKLIGKPGDANRTICTYCVAITLTSIATEFTKNYVGYLRPIYFDQCNPDDQYEICQGMEDTGHYVKVKELHKSFVSGHASFSFVGGTLLTLFLERSFGLSSVEVAIRKPTQNDSQVSSGNPEEEEMQPISPSSSNLESGDDTRSGNQVAVYRRDPGLRRLGSILSLVPMFFSIWSACTRLVDNMHFPADVVGGAILGASIAAYCHPLWFPDPRLPP